MNDKPQKEELTTLMHSAFQVDEATEVKHRAFSALQMIDSGMSIDEAAVTYNVSVEDIKAFEADFRALLNPAE